MVYVSADKRAPERGILITIAQSSRVKTLAISFPAITSCTNTRYLRKLIQKFYTDRAGQKRYR